LGIPPVSAGIGITSWFVIFIILPQKQAEYQSFFNSGFLDSFNYDQFIVSGTQTDFLRMFQTGAPLGLGRKIGEVEIRKINLCFCHFSFTPLLPCLQFASRYIK
jgi:hypothetical protein